MLDHRISIFRSLEMQFDGLRETIEFERMLIADCMCLMPLHVSNFLFYISRVR